jgi:hypothetical protein
VVKRDFNEISFRYTVADDHAMKEKKALECKFSRVSIVAGPVSTHGFVPG